MPSPFPWHSPTSVFCSLVFSGLSCIAGYDLNSLRQLKIIAVENKSISRPVNSPVLPISSNYLGIWHFSADTSSLWEENPPVCWDVPMDARSSQMSTLATCFCSRKRWVALAALCSFLRFEFSCSLLTLVLSLLAVKSSSLKSCQCKQLYPFSARVGQIAFVRPAHVNGAPVVVCGPLWRLKGNRWRALPSSAPKWVPLGSRWKGSSSWCSPVLVQLGISWGHHTTIPIQHWCSRSSAKFYPDQSMWTLTD